MDLNRFAEFETAIDPGWMDYNNHLNDASYAKVLSLANELFLDKLELGELYRRQTGASLYTVDLQISYRAEVSGEDLLRAQSHISFLEPNKLEITTELLRSDGVVAAIGKVRYVHFDSYSKSVTKFPNEKFLAISLWNKIDTTD